MNLTSTTPGVQHSLDSHYRAIITSSHTHQRRLAFEHFFNFYSLNAHHLRCPIGEDPKITIENLHFTTDVELPDYNDNDPAVVFRNCTFHKNCALKLNRAGTLIWENSTYLSSIILAGSFSDLKIKNSYVDQLLFTNSNGNLNIEDCHFASDLSFFKSNFNFVNILRCTFQERFKVEDSKFSEIGIENCTFHHLCLIKSIEALALYLSDCSFTKFDAASEEAYRITKKTMQDRGNERNVELFSQLEIKAHYNALKSEKDIRFLSFIYSEINDFGLDILKPFYLLIYFSICFFCLFYGLNWGQEIIATNGSYPIPNLELSIYYATKIFLGPLSFFSEARSFEFKSIWIYLIIKASAIATSILWFFLIIGVRKRFRMKD